MHGEPTRFADILTTASAVANYLGEADVTAGHVLHAIAIQQGTETIEDLGRPVSPLVRRLRPGERGGAAPAVRELVQRWFAALGNDISAELSEQQLEAFRAELAAMGTEPS